MLHDHRVRVESWQHSPAACYDLAVPDCIVEDDGAGSEDGAAEGEGGEFLLRSSPIIPSISLCFWARERNADSVTGVTGKSNTVNSSPTFSVAYKRGGGVSGVFIKPVLDV